MMLLVVPLSLNIFKDLGAIEVLQLILLSTSAVFNFLLLQNKFQLWDTLGDSTQDMDGHVGYVG